MPIMVFNLELAYAARFFTGPPKHTAHADIGHGSIMYSFIYLYASINALMSVGSGSKAETFAHEICITYFSLLRSAFDSTITRLHH